MTATTNDGHRLTEHQQRVLAALLLLEQTHRWNWWSRDVIGYVVGAGGFHDVIQKKTISILKAKGLVQTERSSWSAVTRETIKCGCACHAWGLTQDGRSVATAVRVRCSDDARLRLEKAKLHLRSWWRDEDEPPPGWDNRDDDDGDDGDSRTPVGPQLSPAVAS